MTAKTTRSMKSIPFIKMQGLGNDYVYIDCFRQQISSPSDLARQISNRHYGIGSDGLVLILPSDKADIRMRMFNADGSEAQMCGNAARCVGKYAYEHGIVNKTTLTLETLAGIKQLQLHLNSDDVETITVNMGKPIFGMEISFENHILNCINIGNPHAVIFTDNLDNINLHQLGPTIENLPCFSEKVNVEIANVQNNRDIKVLVWERGTGETQACGTGACAVAVAAFKKKLAIPPMNIHLKGGTLIIGITPQGEILMTGPAKEVFTGNITI